jgi:uncharacterized membrane protein YkvA (DUF1232 family)
VQDRSTPRFPSDRLRIVEIGVICYIRVVIREGLVDITVRFRRQSTQRDFRGEDLNTLGAWLRLPSIVWRLIRDRRMPLGPKIILALAVVYLFLPFGIIPDRAFGFVGYLDDIALMGLAIAWLLARAPTEVMRDALNGPES